MARGEEIYERIATETWKLADVTDELASRRITEDVLRKAMKNIQNETARKARSGTIAAALIAGVFAIFTTWMTVSSQNVPREKYEALESQFYELQTKPPSPSIEPTTIIEQTTTGGQSSTADVPDIHIMVVNGRGKDDPKRLTYINPSKLIRRYADEKIIAAEIPDVRISAQDIPDDTYGSIRIYANGADVEKAKLLWRNPCNPKGAEWESHGFSNCFRFKEFEADEITVKRDDKYLIFCVSIDEMYYYFRLFRG